VESGWFDFMSDSEGALSNISAPLFGILWCRRVLRVAQRALNLLWREIVRCWVHELPASNAFPQALRLKNPYSVSRLVPVCSGLLNAVLKDARHEMSSQYPLAGLSSLIC
jgi:hypothetical protein